MSGRNKTGQPRHARRRRDPDGPPRPPRRSPNSYGDKGRRVIYIAAEGGRTEGDYVRWLNRTYGELPCSQPFWLDFCHPGANGARPEEVVRLVLDRSTAADDERWALFDRDSADNRDADIPAAMRLAATNGVQVAFSHPSFELWLLLHFQHFTSQEGGTDKTVKERLRKHPDAEGFEKYDIASGDRGKGLDAKRSSSLSGRGETAVRNAQKLVDRCPHGACSHTNATTAPIEESPEPYADWVRRTGHATGCDPLRRDPSSDVWRLLVSLGIVPDRQPKRP